MSNSYSTSISETTDNSQSYSIADQSTNKEVAQELQFTGNSGSTFNLIDGGALAAAKEIALSAGSTARDAVDQSYALAKQIALRDSQAFMSSAVKIAAILGGVGLGGFMLFLVVRKKKEGKKK